MGSIILVRIGVITVRIWIVLIIITWTVNHIGKDGIDHDEQGCILDHNSQD